MGRARQPRRHQALVQVPGRGVAQLVDGDVVETDLDVAADPGRARRVQAAHQGEGGRHPGHVVDHGQAKAGRGAVRLAGHRKKAALRLDQEIVPGQPLREPSQPYADRWAHTIRGLIAFRSS